MQSVRFFFYASIVLKKMPTLDVHAPNGLAAEQTNEQLSPHTLAWVWSFFICESKGTMTNGTEITSTNKHRSQHKAEQKKKKKMLASKRRSQAGSQLEATEKKSWKRNNQCLSLDSILLSRFPLPAARSVKARATMADVWLQAPARIITGRPADCWNIVSIVITVIVVVGIGIYSSIAVILSLSLTSSKSFIRLPSVTIVISISNTLVEAMNNSHHRPPLASTTSSPSSSSPWSTMSTHCTVAVNFFAFYFYHQGWWNEDGLERHISRRSLGMFSSNNNSG